MRPGCKYIISNFRNKFQPVYLENVYPGRTFQSENLDSVSGEHGERGGFTPPSYSLLSSYFLILSKYILAQIFRKWDGVAG